ncbi:MAG: caspase family protein [Cyanobacteria bacterium TGS_CYA1]|nr:caspase family protein [Cyanobacteria bacterium TGS_CYA1]
MHRLKSTILLFLGFQLLVPAAIAQNEIATMNHTEIGAAQVRISEELKRQGQAGQAINLRAAQIAGRLSKLLSPEIRNGRSFLLDEKEFNSLLDQLAAEYEQLDSLNLNILSMSEKDRKYFTDGPKETYNQFGVDSIDLAIKASKESMYAKAQVLEASASTFRALANPLKGLQFARARLKLESTVPFQNNVKKAFLLAYAGELCYQARDLTSAERYYRQGLELVPINKNGYISDRLSEVLAAQGRYKEAIELVLAAPEQENILEKFSTLLQLSKLYWRLDDKTTSNMYSQNAFKLLAGNETDSDFARKAAEYELLVGHDENVIRRLTPSVVEFYWCWNKSLALKTLLMRSLANARQGNFLDSKKDFDEATINGVEEVPIFDELRIKISNILANAKIQAEIAEKPIGERYALLVGIGNFADPSIPKLKYAVNDAQDIGKFLTNSCGFKTENVKTLCDSQASRENILEQLGNKWLPLATKPEDLIFIFLSSHGTPAYRDLAALNYIITHDTKVDKLFSTAIPMQEICRLLKTRCKAKRVYLLADTCYSGGLSKILPSSSSASSAGNINPSEFIEGTNMLVIAASDVNQKSWESKRSPNGVFTRHLLSVLKENSKFEDFHTVFDKIKESTKTEVLEDEKTDQIPQIAGFWNGKGLSK